MSQVAIVDPGRRPLHPLTEPPGHLTLHPRHDLLLRILGGGRGRVTERFGDDLGELTATGQEQCRDLRGEEAWVGGVVVVVGGGWWVVRRSTAGQAGPRHLPSG